MKTKLFSHFRNLPLAILILTTLISQAFYKVGVALAANPAPIQVFYLSMPEDEVFASFKKISSAAPAAPMHSVTGISVTTTNTQIYYDQWENGYEADLANPVNVYSSLNLGGTQIWGNHLAADGCPPNVDGRTALVCSDANDILSLGNVIVLENDVPLPRTSALFYDGRDKLGGTTVIAVTRSVWANSPGTVLADAVEVYDTTRWGTSYELPIGENTTNNPQNATVTTMFNYSSVLIIAAENGTSVTIDKDGPGATAPATVILNQGDAYQVDGGMKMGGTITSTKPVQANLLTGKLASTYASRWYSLPPQSYWTDSLWTSVGTTVTNYPATVFIYNPSDSTSMTVNYETKLGTGTFSVPANGTYRFEMPLLSGAHFFTSGIPFQAVGGMDASLTGGDQTYDWGFTLVPDTWLTTAFIAGWAPGNATYTGNGSPIWVTAVKATTIYVDYGAPSPVGANLDPKGRPYDVSYAIGQYESKQITGIGNTQTGIKVWTADGTSITGAWGENPKTASAGTPYLDVGYTIPPLPEVIISKQADLAIDLNSNGQADPGDTLQYTLTIRNNGAVTAFNIAITDSIPAHTTYVAGSTKLNGTPVADNPSFPLLGAGLLVASINIGGSVEATYKMKTDTTPPIYSEIVNTANANINGDMLSITLHTPVTSSATTCTASFMNSGYSGTVTLYEQNGTAYIQVTDLDKNVNAAVLETISAQVVNASTADRQLITLTETGAATGIFRTSLPTSSTTGQLPDDGTLYALTGNSIQITYTDPLYGDTCNASASISAPTQTKQLYLSETLALDRIDPVVTADLTTAESAALFSGGSGTITAAATTGASSTGAVTSFSFSHTPGSGGNRLLLVSIATGSPNNSAAAGTISGVTFGGVAMTLVGGVTSASGGTNTNSYIYMMNNAAIPTTGAANVVITSTSSTIVASATTFTNVDQTTPLGTYRSNTGTTGILGLATAYISATGEVLYSVGSIEQGSNDRVIATPVTQAELWNVSNHPYVDAATSTIAGAASVSPTYTNSSNRTWTIGVVAIKPAGASGNPTATYTLAPALTKTLSVPANATVTAPIYLNVTSGSMPATPSITGVLKRGTTYASATTFATLSTASNSGGLLSLSGSTTGSVTNLAPNEFIYFDVTTAQSGVTFTIRYDSNAYPSKINLPTTTVIKVDSLDIYDAPSPAGALISNPSSGQTVYLRGSISDPFGYADITSAVLDITDPSNATTTQTSTPANIVSSSGASTLFEFPWVIPSTTGTYSIKLTGKEGYENSVTDSRTNLVTIAFQDTGTPSSIEFTSTVNGTVATSYDPAASPTDQVCLRVSDFDQNQITTAVETITVTLNSSKGDTQTVTLTETGINTGVFAACVTREITSGAAGTEPDGQIYALAGDLFTASYNDPNDPADTSSTTAVMTSSTSTLTLLKQVVVPSNAVAVVGETVRFDLVVANPNDNAMTTVNLTDAYPGACLTYSSASIAPDNPAANPLVWSNIGPIASHANKTVSVYFTASAVCSPAVTNQVDAYAIDSLSNRIPGSGTLTATADITTTQPGLSITKAIKNGSPNPSQIGQDVTFTIDITNTGTTDIATLPLIDNYSAYCMEFKSATDGGSGSGGVISWSNLGPLTTINKTKHVEVTFTVQGPCNPGTNSAPIDSAYDINGDPLPAVQSSVDFITQSSAPQITKNFSLTAIAINGTSTLTFTITNPNLLGPLTGIAFTDTYPTGLVNDTPLATTNTCTGGLLTVAPGGGSISYSGGTLAANTSCAITVMVKAVNYGALNNSITVSAINSLTTGTDSDTLNSTEIIAGDDTASMLNGAVGGPSLANVLVNDSLNGTTPVLLANVNLTQESTTNSGVTLNPTTGAVNVAAGTPTGNYTVTYKICEKTNPTICDTATVTVPVISVDAVADSGTAINGAAGGQALANVLANDSLSGTSPALLASVNLTQVSTTNAGVTLNLTDGSINVTVATPSGMYTVTYQICDKANPTVCDTAAVSITVVTIDAINDTGAEVFGSTGGQALANVLANDSLNGTTPVLLANVNLTQESTTNSGVTLNPATGSVNVAAGTPTGSYTVTYKICDKLNASICDTATVTVPVLVIDAVNDSGASVNGTAGGQSLVNVLSNDSLNGTTPIPLASVNLTQESTTDPNVTLNVADGSVNVAAGTSSGSYTVTYKICDKAHVTLCDTATVTVNVTQQEADLSLTKSVDISSPKYGDTVIFTITLTNHSLTTAATTVVVSDAMPLGLSYSSDLPSLGTYNSTSGNWSIASLSANSSATLKITAVVTDVGTIVNTAEITESDQVDPDSTPGNHVSAEDDQASVSVGALFDPPIGFKTFDDQGIPVMQYRMVWINSGNTTAIDVQISDAIPVGTTYVPGTFTCLPQGSSANAAAATLPLSTTLTNSYCAYDPAVNQVQWQGSIGPDNGNLTEADAANEVILTFQVRVDDAVNTVYNFATSRTDANGNANFTDNSVIGTSMILSNMTTWTRTNTSGTAEVDLPSTLPKTGFAPFEQTILPNQPAEKIYSSTDQWIEIPRLGVNIPLVGIPLVNGAWDVSWLTKQAGWLNGTAFPTWNGNSVLTSHVYMADGKPGPFINLSGLKYGDKVIIHSYGNAYTYEVRENKVVAPDDVTVLGHKAEPWLTLITCKKYIESANKYASRVAVQAVLINVTAESKTHQSDRER